MKYINHCIVFFIVLTSCSSPDPYSRLEDYTNPGSLARLKKGKMIQASSFDTTGANNDRINIHPGDSATLLDVQGPGLISRIWITIDSRDPHFLRRILLRFYWDGEENPSVLVPVGDFFGCGYEYKHYTAQYLGMSSGGYYCYFPMPFNKSARLDVVNETGQEIFAFYYHINHFQLDKPFSPDIAYFHASWNRSIRTDDPENYTVLETEGEGHFVGCNLHAEPYEKSFWYLEGDEMVYVDDEPFPSIYGTGTEDYFTSGWYYKNGEYAAPYHGLILKDEKTKRTVAYRHHIPDPIPFTKSLRFTIEHGHGNEETIDLSSTAYWYQREPHKPLEILQSSLRIPLREIVPNDVLEAEALEYNSKSLKASIQDMSSFGPEWSNLRQLKIQGSPGASFTLATGPLYETTYDALLYYTTGPDYGIVETAIEGDKKGSFDGFGEQIYPGRVKKIKALETQNGRLVFTFTTAGKNPSSEGFNVGLDAIKLTPVRSFIPEWHMIGPFPNERESDLLRYGLDEPYPPEEEVVLDGEYSGVDGQKIRWQKIQTPENGYVSLWDKVNPYEFVVCYAVSYIYSREKQTVPLLLGSDDGIKVFLNDETIHRFLDVRIAAPDQDTIPLKLRKGWNELLLKIENNFGGYAFYARVIDRENKLRFVSSIARQTPPIRPTNE
jgi:hypothetical protein